MRRLIYIAPLVVFLAVAGYFAVQIVQISSGKDVNTVPSALIGEPAPQFDLPPLYDDGAGLATADLAGEVTIVNVFASWCVPCRAEHPLLVRLAGRDGVTLHGIAYKDEPADTKAFLAELGNPYARIGVDRKGRAAIEWGVAGVPETYIVDRTGTVRYKRTGPLTERHLTDDVLPLLAELNE